MKGRRSTLVLVALFLLLGLSLILSSAIPAGAQVKPVLTNEDCVKCHEGPPADIASAGEDHKTEVTCQDCHADHRPASKENIPTCDECHDGEPHYALEGCLGCHTNPHAPLKITVGDKVTDPCLSCHDAQIAQLKEFKSLHTDLFCSTCHDVHRKIPACVDCHDSHSETMTQADCSKCHKAHKPMELVYGETVPNTDCASCHKTAFKMLSGTVSKHRTVMCVKCHQERHTMVPDCQNCHPKPHPEGIFVKFPKCGDCHYIAHDLNNWPADAKKAAPKK